MSYLIGMSSLKAKVGHMTLKEGPNSLLLEGGLAKSERKLCDLG